MKKKLLAVIGLVFVLGSPVYGQEDTAKKYAATIKAPELRELLTIIASDALEGRQAGSRGQKMAAAFIKEEFKNMGLQPIVPGPCGPGYLQSFTLAKYDIHSIYLANDKQTFDLSAAVLYAGRQELHQPQSAPALLIDTTRLKGSNNLSDRAVFITGRITNRQRQQQLSALAYQKGAAMVVFVPFASQKEFNSYLRNERRFFASRRYSFLNEIPAQGGSGYFVIGPAVLAGLLELDNEEITKLLGNPTGKKARQLNAQQPVIRWLTSKPSRTLETENVLGYLEGSDKKDEVVVITAHYDHIGRQGNNINNGADDDGSGTVSVLAIARAFSQAKAAGHGPRRSILFMTVTAEEMGLIGSQYYTLHPVLPLSQTVVDLNIDMIGRYDPAHENNKNFVYLVGSDKLSADLHQLSEQTNATYTQLQLDYTYNDENHPDRIYYRSDHWNFAKNNIPIIFYFSGVHEDYHRPTDTVDKIAFDLLEKRARLVFHTAWAIANRDARLRLD